MPPGVSILSISYIGYKSTEVAAAPSLTVTLKDDSQVLNDVVVHRLWFGEKE